MACGEEHRPHAKGSLLVFCIAVAAGLREGRGGVVDVVEDAVEDKMDVHVVDAAAEMMSTFESARPGAVYHPPRVKSSLGVDADADAEGVTTGDDDGSVPAPKEGGHQVRLAMSGLSWLGVHVSHKSAESSVDADTAEDAEATTPAEAEAKDETKTHAEAEGVADADAVGALGSRGDGKYNVVGSLRLAGFSKDSFDADAVVKFREGIAGLVGVSADGVFVASVVDATAADATADADAASLAAVEAEKSEGRVSFSKHLESEDEAAADAAGAEAAKAGSDSLSFIFSTKAGAAGSSKRRRRLLAETGAEVEFVVQTSDAAAAKEAADAINRVSAADAAAALQSAGLGLVNASSASDGEGVVNASLSDGEGEGESGGGNGGGSLTVVNPAAVFSPGEYSFTPYNGVQDQKVVTGAGVSSPPSAVDSSMASSRASTGGSPPSTGEGEGPAARASSSPSTVESMASARASAAETKALGAGASAASVASAAPELGGPPHASVGGGGGMSSGSTTVLAGVINPFEAGSPQSGTGATTYLRLVPSSCLSNTTTSSSSVAAGSYAAAPEGEVAIASVVAGVAMPWSFSCSSPYGVADVTSPTMYL